MNLSIVAFWVVKLCGLVGGCQRSSETLATSYKTIRQPTTNQKAN
jgi:hypothetical protein